MIEDLCYGTGLFMYIQAVAAPPRPLLVLLNLNFPDDGFINSFIVYELFLSYNEVHETDLVIDEVQERRSGTDHQGAGFI